MDKPIWSFYSKGKRHAWTCLVGAAEGHRPQRKTRLLVDDASGFMMEPRLKAPCVGWYTTMVMYSCGSHVLLVVDSWVCKLLGVIQHSSWPIMTWNSHWLTWEVHQVTERTMQQLLELWPVPQSLLRSFTLLEDTRTCPGTNMSTSMAIQPVHNDQPSEFMPVSAPKISWFIARPAKAIGNLWGCVERTNGHGWDNLTPRCIFQSL